MAAGIPNVGILITAKSAAAAGANAAVAQLERIRMAGARVRNVLFSAQGMLATFGLSVGAAAVSRFLLDTNRRTESLVAQLKVLEGSKAGAQAVFNAIEDFAERTPFQIDELTESYIRLRTAGISPTEEMLVNFGDIASGRGKSILEFAMAVEDAVTGEMERLKEFGIKAKQSGDMVAMTFNGVTTQVRNTTDGITAYLQEVGRSAVLQGSMAEQMETLNGSFSNALDNAATLARTIGEEGGLNEEIKAGTAEIIELTKAVNENSDAVADWTGLVISGAKAIAQSLIFPIRVLFNLGQIVGRTAEAILYDINYIVLGIVDAFLGGYNAIVTQANRLPGVNLALAGRITDQVNQYWEAAKAASADVLLHTQDILAATGNLGQSYRDVAAAVGEFRREREKAARVSDLGGDGDGSGGGGGSGGASATGKALTQEIALLQEAKELRTLQRADLARALEIEDQIAARLRAENLTLQQRVELLKQLAGIRAVTGVPVLERRLGGTPADRLERHHEPGSARHGQAVLPFGGPVRITRQDQSAMEKYGASLREALSAGGDLSQLLSDMTLNTVSAFGDAVTNAFENFVTGAEDAGEAFKNAMLASIGAVAKGLGDFYAGKAVAAIAEGIGTKDPSQFAAAAKFMAAATAMYAIAGTFSGLAAGGGGGGGGAETAQRDTDRLSGSTRGDAVVILEGSWNGFLMDPQAQDSFAELLENLSGRNVIVRRG